MVTHISVLGSDNVIIIFVDRLCPKQLESYQLEFFGIEIMKTTKIFFFKKDFSLTIMVRRLNKTHKKVWFLQIFVYGEKNMKLKLYFTQCSVQQSSVVSLHIMCQFSFRRHY